jgi:hypothetical protein
MFKSKLCILTLFGLATFLAAFQNIGQFFLNHRHPGLLVRAGMACQNGPPSSFGPSMCYKEKCFEASKP